MVVTISILACWWKQDTSGGLLLTSKVFNYPFESGFNIEYVHLGLIIGWLPLSIVTRITERFQICGNFLKVGFFLALAGLLADLVLFYLH